MAPRKRLVEERNTIKSGTVIRIGPWHGVVLEVYKSLDKEVLLVQFVKNILKGQQPEYVAIGSVTIFISTIQDMTAEYKAAVAQHSEAFVSLKKKIKNKGLTYEPREE